MAFWANPSQIFKTFFATKCVKRWEFWKIPRKLVTFWKFFEKCAEKGEILPTFCENNKVHQEEFKKILFFSCKISIFCQIAHTVIHYQKFYFSCKISIFFCFLLQFLDLLENHSNFQIFVTFWLFLCKIIVRLTRGRKKGRQKELTETRKILKIFKFQAKISNFSKKKNSENFQGFALKFFQFSLNFHSIFKRNFWFCEIHLWKIQIEREKKKLPNLSFVWRESGEKAILENSGKFWLIFGISCEN